MRVWRTVVRTFFAVSIVISGATCAGATPTSVLESANGPDLMGDWNLVAPTAAGHEGVLGYLYGWQNLTRIDDEGFPGYELGDRMWRLGYSPTGVEVRARAHFSGYAAGFGVANSLGEFQGSILGVDDTQQGYLNLPTQRTTSSDPVSRLVLIAGDEGRVFDSLLSDRMVTFLISGNASQYGRDYSANPLGAFVVAWEDAPVGLSDRDYNDLVLELRGAQLVQDPLPPIPEPATILLFGSGVAAMWWRRRRQPGAASR